MKRISSIDVATTLGVLLLVAPPSFAEGGTHVVTDGVTSVRVTNDSDTAHLAVAHGGSTMKPTRRMGDWRVEVAQRKAEAQKIKSQQK